MKSSATTCLFALLLGVLAPVFGHAAETAGNGFPLRSAANPAYQAYSAYPDYPPAPAKQAAAPVPPSATPSSAVHPAAAPADPRNFESQPLSFSAGRRRADAEGREYKLPSLWSGLLAVVFMCGLFGCVLWVMKKYLPGHRQLFSHPAMEVLGRTHLDQRRYVSLLRVGKRIVVVGVSPDEMRALSEITDEDEITGIMEVARPKTEAGLTLFQRMFQKNVVEAEARETRAMAAAKAEELRDQMSTLREHVREFRSDGEPKTARRALDRVG